MIRALGPADAGALVEVVARALPEAWSAEAVAAELGRDDAHVWGAEEGGALVGWIMLRRAVDQAELLLIGVDLGWRRRGVARALWAAGEAAVRAAGAERVFLEVRAGNAPAIALYRGLGFREVGRRRGYYRAPLEDALVMARDLAGASVDA